MSARIDCSDAVRELREHLGLTLEEMAKLMELNRATIFRYENRLLVPKNAVLRNFAAVSLEHHKDDLCRRFLAPISADQRISIADLRAAIVKAVAA